MDKLPFGNAVWSMIRANSSVDKGVDDAGFRMIGQPAAMAGAIL
jgi:hypothetical protein